MRLMPSGVCATFIYVLKFGFAVTCTLFPLNDAEISPTLLRYVNLFLPSSVISPVVCNIPDSSRYWRRLYTMLSKILHSELICAADLGLARMQFSIFLEDLSDKMYKKTSLFASPMSWNTCKFLGVLFFWYKASMIALHSLQNNVRQTRWTFHKLNFNGFYLYVFLIMIQKNLQKLLFPQTILTEIYDLQKCKSCTALYFRF